MNRPLFTAHRTPCLPAALFLVFLAVTPVARAGASHHGENPIHRPVGTVKYHDYWLPTKRNQPVDLSNLFITVWDGTPQGKPAYLGRARAKARLVDARSTTNKLINPPWVAANGAILYRAYVYELEQPLRNRSVFNNNTDHSVDPRSWSWIRLKKPLRHVTVCYTSRGMIATPDMPQKGMKPAPLKN